MIGINRLFVTETRMSTQSLWLDEVPLQKRYPTLGHAIEVPIAVVGGGMVGLLTAYYLAKSGKEVVVLEKGKIGSGDSAYTTAILTYLVDGDLLEFRRQFGDKKAKQVWESNLWAIDELERVIKTEDIDANFARSDLFMHASLPEDADWLKKICLLARSFDFPVRFQKEGAHEFQKYGVLTIPEQATMQPRAFLQGLAQRVVELGGRIYEDTMVIDFAGPEKNVLITPKADVTAHEVVIATHVPVDHRMEIPARVEPKRTYVVAARIPTGTLQNAVYLDTADPYHYARVHKGEEWDTLILGGEDHYPGEHTEPELRFAALELEIKKMIGSEQFMSTHRWSGEVFESSDMLPFIGRSLFSKHHLIASGFAGSGMTYSVIAARMFSDILNGKEVPWEGVYSPVRFKGWKRLMKFGLHYTERMVKDRVKARNMHPKVIENLRAGDGVVHHDGSENVASSKDKITQNVKSVSARCTHLGCLVEWNLTEETWDCPCHGSRFAPDGTVISGPAKDPLRPIKFHEE